MAVRYGVARELGTGQAIAKGSRVLAVAGIARPQRFFRALQERGFDIRRELVFRDHYWFSAADVERIAAVARDVGADAIVTTEKDAVRIEPRVRGAGMPWAAFPMEVTIEPAAGFLAWLGPRV
jgi:tetraacyldisaccharide 4'-kinase